MSRAVAVSLVVLAWALIAWPTLDLPWGTCDDPETFKIALRIDAAPPLARLAAAGPAGGASFPGRFSPLLWLWLWATWKVCGTAVLWHRLVHLTGLLAIAQWVLAAVARAGAGWPRAVLAAMAFLMFPAMYELWPELQPIEPWQVLAAIAYVEALARERHVLAAATLLVCLALKETSFCLALPLAVATALDGSAWRRRWPVWVVLVGWLALFWWARPPAAARDWAAHYRPGVATCAATLAGVLAMFWKSSALLVPVGLAGAARAGGEPVDRRRIALAAAWAAGGLAIFLPWSQLAPRHYAWFGAPLAVVLGAGFARRGRLACALGTASLIWMAAQHAVVMSQVEPRYRHGDRSFWAMLDGVDALIGPGGRVLDPRGGAAEVLATYLTNCRGRAGLVAGRLAVHGPARAGDVVVVAGPTVEEALAALAPAERAGLELRGTVENARAERDLPEPRWAFALARRALAGERGPDGTLGSLIVPVLFTRRNAYAVLTPRASP